MRATAEQRSSALGAEADDAAPEQQLAGIRRQLDEVHAKLCVVERQRAGKGADRARVPAPTPAAAGQWERPQAAVGLVRQEWMAAARRLDDLEREVPTPRPPMLEALGCECGVVSVAGDATHLSRRHTEILVLLASDRGGMTTEELALALYGEAGRPANVRTELCRLRKGLGQWIHSEPHRVETETEIEADFLVVQSLLRAGRAREAALRYTAPLLPRSEAPGVVDLRNDLDAWVRSAVMASGTEALWAWLESRSGYDDVPAWKRLLADLDPADPRRPLAVSRLARLRSRLTVVQ
jgi:hypothetical protein